jgi:hypothetical protein
MSNPIRKRALMKGYKVDRADMDETCSTCGYPFDQGDKCLRIDEGEQADCSTYCVQRHKERIAEQVTEWERARIAERGVKA